MKSSRIFGRLLILEAIVCLSSTAYLVLFGLLFALHHTVIVLRFNGNIPANQIPHHLYTFGALFGLFAAVTLLRTKFGRTASQASLWLARFGVVMGILAVAVIPSGSLPLHRFNEVNLSSELFESLLPLTCLAHFAFLGRERLFALDTPEVAEGDASNGV